MIRALRCVLLTAVRPRSKSVCDSERLVVLAMLPIVRESRRTGSSCRVNAQAVSAPMTHAPSGSIERRIIPSDSESCYVADHSELTLASLGA
ncbi:hypothetical protein DAEQUDRAFT_519707 [Daedalea quercina L-15889]|uniref:Uncharacterized protein n=1 Tax=Daedalea quercina L-15889 TaxID=1314783 RepID=A0A165MEQ0_9APHY|nr:hypothetical protein DAEQUDRAFT_519707 [Daedalea quercina L-15889]